MPCPTSPCRYWLGVTLPTPPGLLPGSSLTLPAFPSAPFIRPLSIPTPATTHTQLDALTREMENGRLFRLVSKLAFVTDRPSSDVGAASGDTGNSYLLQLFRDFVFHQGERDAGRVIDWGHIVENLNKVGAPDGGAGRWRVCVRACVCLCGKKERHWSGVRLGASAHVW